MNELAEKINALVAANQTQKAFQLLFEKLSSESEVYPNIVLRSRDYQELKKVELSGVLSAEELSRRKNRINLDLLKIVKTLEEKDLKIYESNSSISKQNISSRQKNKWRWLSVSILLCMVFLFFIFQNLFEPKPEYLWRKIPGTDYNFKLTRLDSNSNHYHDVTDETESQYVGADVIVYDKTGKKTMLLKNYKVQSPDENPAQILEPQSIAYWKKTPDLRRFNIYDKGILVTKAKVIADQIDEDLIVYCTSNDATYLIKNYISIKDVRLRPVQKLSPHARAYWKGVWPGKLFYLYDRGKNISSEAQSFFEENDLIVIHTTENIRFRLKNYKELQDNKFRPAIIEK